MAHGFVVENEGNGVQKETAEEIAMEEEKLKNDSAEDVRRQLEQQHVAESEEKAVQVGCGWNIMGVWLTPMGLPGNRARGRQAAVAQRRSNRG